MPNQDMTGDGHDVCSFFANFIQHRQSMERLLNWLRQSQTTCTDTNCFDDLNALPGSEHGSPLLNTNQQTSEGEPFHAIMVFLFGLLTLFALNISRGRNQTRTEKPLNSSDYLVGRHRRNEDNDDDSRPAL